MENKKNLITLHSNDKEIIKEVFHCQECDILNIRMLKKGMTNHSFIFECLGEKYIIRIPGEGTGELIDRHHEAQAYQTIEPYHICEKPVYINAQNGYKITRFIENIRVCNPQDAEQVHQCMQKLRAFHELNLQVNYSFDLFGKINYYENLRQGTSSIHEDYSQVKANVFSLKPYIQSHILKKCLCHIDSVPDNFLFDDSCQGKLHLQLTDWEYAAMQDPDIDVAMFCVYSMYRKEQIDRAIDLYYENQCPRAIRAKIYCYIAACGLLWSNWCEYKNTFGVHFEEYETAQYNYAKEYYRIAKEMTLQ